MTHPPLDALLDDLLAGEPEFQVLGETGSAEGIAEMLRLFGSVVVALPPDVIALERTACRVVRETMFETKFFFEPGMQHTPSVTARHVPAPVVDNFAAVRDVRMALHAELSKIARVLKGPHCKIRMPWGPYDILGGNGVNGTSTQIPSNMANVPPDHADAVAVVVLIGVVNFGTKTVSGEKTKNPYVLRQHVVPLPGGSVPDICEEYRQHAVPPGHVLLVANSGALYNPPPPPQSIGEQDTEDFFSSRRCVPPGALLSVMRVGIVTTPVGSTAPLLFPSEGTAEQIDRAGTVDCLDVGFPRPVTSVDGVSRAKRQRRAEAFRPELVVCDKNEDGYGRPLGSMTRAGVIADPFPCVFGPPETTNNGPRRGPRSHLFSAAFTDISDEDLDLLIPPLTDAEREAACLGGPGDWMCDT